MKNVELKMKNSGAGAKLAGCFYEQCVSLIWCLKLRSVIQEIYDGGNYPDLLDVRSVLVAVLDGELSL